MAKPQRRLATHISVKHPELTRKTRLKLLARAKQAPSRYIPQVAAQRKLKFGAKSTHTIPNTVPVLDRDSTGTGLCLNLTHSSPNDMDEHPNDIHDPDDCSQPTASQPSHHTPTRGTRSLPLFPLSHPEMEKFKIYLMSLDGKRRESHTAEAICRDIGKMLFYASPAKLNWKMLVNSDRVGCYMEVLQRRGMQADGQLTKLERLSDALNFVEINGHISVEESARFKAKLVKWKRTLRSEKERRTVERMERESEQVMDLNDITKVLDNKAMWKNVDRNLEKARQGKIISADDMKFVTSVLMLCIKIKSYQR